jgi:hypothetical protein
VAPVHAGRRPARMFSQIALLCAGFIFCRPNIGMKPILVAIAIAELLLQAVHRHTIPTTVTVGLHNGIRRFGSNAPVAFGCPIRLERGFVFRGRMLVF